MARIIFVTTVLSVGRPIVLRVASRHQGLQDSYAPSGLKSKSEPAAVAMKFEQFNQEARNKGLRNALIAIGVLGLFGFAASCFLPGGKTKKPAAEPEATAPPAAA